MEGDVEQMTAQTAGDIMVPLDEYPIVDASSTVLDAVIRLDDSRRNTKPGKQPFQAVLVTDDNGNIIGKIGQLALLRALQPQSRMAGDQDSLERAGVSDTLMETALEHARRFQVQLPEMCAGASTLAVNHIMAPLHEHIDEGAPVCEVVHQILAWQSLSLLVTKGNRPVGLVRLSDLCDEVMQQMREATADSGGEDK